MMSQAAICEFRGCWFRSSNPEITDVSRLMRVDRNGPARGVRGHFEDHFGPESSPRVLDSITAEPRGRGKPGCRAAHAMNCAPNGTNRKQIDITIAYAKSRITGACYLCNTHPKTPGLRPFGAVPLLRVQKPSVIVMLRRRGASRGRPVLGGSLKSLAFMRVCPKARSG